MGDFDRNDNSGKRNEAKKLVAVLGLGVVLIVLVAMQFMKNGGPQAAAGAPVNNGVALPPPVVSEEISEKALANMINDLQNDPTKPLLRNGAATDHALDATPRNPFSLSNVWLNELIRPVSTASQTQPQHTEPRPYVTSLPVNAAQPLALRAEEFKLASIINGNMAVINGKVVKAGDVVGKARIVDIREDGVTLQLADFPNGPRMELSIQPRLNKE